MEACSEDEGSGSGEDEFEVVGENVVDVDEEKMENFEDVDGHGGGGKLAMVAMLCC